MKIYWMDQSPGSSLKKKKKFLKYLKNIVYETENDCEFLRNLLIRIPQTFFLRDSSS